MGRVCGRDHDYFGGGDDRRSDVVFAGDSIPAIFAITSSAFIVWTADAFAVLGLRPLYFKLAGVMKRFVYPHSDLSIVLIFVGAKFVVSDLVGKAPIYYLPALYATRIYQDGRLDPRRPLQDT